MNHYVYGATRWKRFKGSGDVRLYRPAKGWVAQAWQLDQHPLTDKPFKQAQWWIREFFEHGGLQ